VEENNKYWISTTQKTTATLHEVPSEFFEMLWGQFDKSKIISDGLIENFASISGGEKLDISEPMSMSKGGFALDFWIQVDEFKNNTILEGENIELTLNKNGTIKFFFTNGSERMSLISDINSLEKKKKHHVAILVDAKAKLCYMLVDGSICDGAGQEIFGFKWFTNELADTEVHNLFAEKFPGQIDKLRLSGQQMFTSQFVSNYIAEY